MPARKEKTVTADDSFARDGFLGPVPILTAEQCAALLNHFESDKRPPPAVWGKGGALTDWVLSGLGAHPRLLALLTPILGENIVLWGASLIRRAPGEVHPWHVDIESASPDGRFVTAWIGLRNTSSASSVRLIAGSHRCNTIQQFRAESGSARDEASTETAIEWARSANSDARLVEPDMKDGEAMLFDGRMWHGSDNRRDEGARAALLLQFAAADSAVRIPDPEALDWPFKPLQNPRPPVLLVQGRAQGARNRIVAPPIRGAPTKLPRHFSAIHKLPMPLPEDLERGWRRFPLFKGATPAIDSMACHAAVLSAGHSPHPPHAHGDEELLIVLDGEADLLIADRPEYDGARAVRVATGDFAYYPAGQHHTIRNPGTSPVAYMMFRWNRSASPGAPNPLKASLFRAPPAVEARGGRGFVIQEIFSGPTRWLRKLHCHASRLEPGAGYAPHVDPYDVAILIQSGRVKTLGWEAGPGSLIYYSAGEMHGMKNVGDEPAHYLVFEFHGARPVAARQVPARPARRQLPASPEAAPA
jgi:quercetin dioxygenase-like cupin family protein